MNSIQVPVIQLKNLGFAYPGPGRASPTLPVLEQINLTVAASEIVAIVGPSGSGKSTLLNLVAGLRTPLSGQVLIDGHAGERLGRFNYMPQGDALLPWLRAVDNASLLLRLHGVSRSKAEKCAKQMLTEFGLAEFTQSLPDELSGGMRQRVALIRTFLPDGDVLLDEPFGALDAITRGDLQEWLLRLQAATGKAVLIVTHDLDEAIFLADRVYLLSSRPARVISMEEIPLERPRRLEVTATSEFVAIKSRLLAKLRAGKTPWEPAA